MQIKIFYSWQSDTNPSFNRYFLEKCIKEALKRISNNHQYKLEFELDRDTQGNLGTVEITDTIFDKIRDAHIFICDITIINGHLKDKDENLKLTPNPNVLLELGFAVSHVNWENTICFFNSFYSNVESLPFDLRNRRPYIYKLDEQSTKEKGKSIAKKITEDLVTILTQMNPLKVEGQKEVLKEFYNESYQIRRILNSRPERWIELLAFELFKSEVKKINELYSDIKENLVYRPTKVMNSTEFFIWTRESNENIIQLLGIFDKAKNFLPSTYEEVEENYLFPIELKKSIKKLSGACFHVLEWRIILNSIVPPEEFAQLKPLLMDWPDPFVSVMNEINDGLEFVMARIRGITNIGKPEVVKASFETLPHLNLIQKKMTHWMRNNPDKIEALKI